MTVTVELHSTLQCPQCGHREREEMPTNACQYFYDCKGCGALLKPKRGDCCVFCSYGDVACPPIQEAPGSGCCPTQTGEAAKATVSLPRGATVPDWTLVSSAAGQTALEALCGALLDRWSGLSEREDDVRRTVLSHYAATGCAPQNDDLAVHCGCPVEEVEAALQSLAGRDVIVLDVTGSVVVAYPFASRHTGHRVEFGGATVTAMCAVDALGLGAMLGRNTVIHTACGHCGTPLRIETDQAGHCLRDEMTAGIEVWSGRHSEMGCAATSLCTLQKFFCGGEHLDAWRADLPVTLAEGVRLSLPEALEVGRAIFAPLLTEMHNAV